VEGVHVLRGGEDGGPGGASCCKNAALPFRFTSSLLAQEECDGGQYTTKQGLYPYLDIDLKKLCRLVVDEMPCQAAT
jgi:hypothetical protein